VQKKADNTRFSKNSSRLPESNDANTLPTVPSSKKNYEQSLAQLQGIYGFGAGYSPIPAVNLKGVAL